jgi:rhodanese-related sulfurtransferase
MPEITRTAAEVAAMIEDGREIAFLDVREIVPFGTGHPLLATHLALGHIECEIAGLVPRSDTRVIVTDGGEGLSTVVAHRLARLGYTNVAVLAGGAPAWAAAGLALFPEIEVPSKGFGAFVAHHTRPTFITPRELVRAIASGEDWVLIDSRPRQEYQAGNIPGSIDAPAGQMLRCFDDLVHHPTTKVVMNCMSRTRGILGGTSLARAPRRRAC